MMRLALLCIVTLAIASTVGLVISSNIASHNDAATLKGFLDAPKHTRSTIGKILPMGDPIDDPKPNNVKH